jgi:DNA mismatch repair ATPase MutS
MAGKSTLLRAIALNAVLAQAGGPVCAARMAAPRLRVMTSVAVRDSLAEETSLFLAELRRVKRIVDAARTPPPVPPVLYLLDEVLHGTNSAERRVATRAVLSHLLAARAIGAVSTHDLALAEDEPLHSAARLVHFTETVRDDGDGVPRMTFDYRLRPGLATSTNALVLLRLLGLGAE